MALSLYKHFNYGTLSYSQVDSNWTDIEQEVNGLSARLPLNNYSATTNPTVNNDVTQGYSTGSLWYNRTTDTAFVLTNASSGAANWVERDSISAADLGSAAFADILGTVSQSGGVPTGALMEYGSNANGQYIKYADGTIDLWIPSITMDVDIALDSIYRGFVSWTFPAEINSISTAFGVSSGLSSASTWGGNMLFQTATQAAVRGYATTSQTGVQFQAFVKARWF